ncbi:MAG: rRNA cytosine-C5-methylase [Acidocella sp. 20-57-95]|nr:MAG: rRNA cytosine-C5-methylase [Acidocella sp. 20-57-95]HQT64605.1 transcription antitermination factor NusB [Acidocella sp.]
MKDPTREAAYELLKAVLTRNTSLDAALDGLPKIDARDKAAAHRLAATVLRHTGTLNAVLEGFLLREPPQAVRHILWLGAAASLFLESPPHAAVGTAVDLAKAKKLEAFAGLINAVLRKVAAGGVDLLDGLDMPRLDTPAWAWASWGANARAIATAQQTEAPLDVSVKPGVVMPGEQLPTGSFRFAAGTSVTALPGYEEGEFWVQDVAATLPALILNPQPGERVLDLCAAPGGKTAQLAAAGARVTAVERDAGRMGTLKSNLARLRLDVETVLADATIWRPSEKFGAILLDAPCSATGTIRRHPDLLHIRKARDLIALNRLQDELLNAAYEMLAPGGRLVYAVCSLQPEEGEARVNAACKRLGLRHDRLGLASLPEAVTEDKNIRTHPGLWPERGGMDGFFVARLTKP